MKNHFSMGPFRTERSELNLYRLLYTISLDTVFNTVCNIEPFSMNTTQRIDIRAISSDVRFTAKSF